MWSYGLKKRTCLLHRLEMGVKGLHRFIEECCPDALVKVSISEMVKSFVEENPSIRNPVLVIDGMNCIRRLYGDLDWVCSGQWLELACNVKDFVNSLQCLGLKLVFFFDGITPAHKRAEWIRRRMEGLAEIKLIFDLIKAKAEIPNEKAAIPASISGLIRYVLKYVCGVTVFTVGYGECDQAISSYAAKTHGLGILAQDTDFIIYDTVPLISIDKLDMMTLETIVYDRQVLCQYLQLSVKHLPLFGCLLGNDYVCRESLKPFHMWLNEAHRVSCRKSLSFTSQLACNVARFVHNLKLRPDASDVLRRLPKISKVLSRSRGLLEFIKIGLDTYELNPAVCDLYRDHDEVECSADVLSAEGIFSFVLEKTIHNELSILVHNVIACGTHEQSVTLEDSSSPSFVPSMIIYRPIRRRCYSLIFNFRDKYLSQLEKLPHTGLPPAKDTSVKEWCVSSIKKNDMRPDQVRPLPVVIDGNVPDLLSLWMHNTHANADIKWEVLRSCLELSLSVRCLREIPDRFKLLCILLAYLNECSNIKINSMELNAFLVQAVLPCSYDIGWLRSLQVQPYNERAVHLSAVFMRGTAEVLHVLTICGSPYPVENSMPWDCFDGKRFHYCYTSLKSGVALEALCSNNVDSLDVFNHLKHTVLGNLCP